MSSKTRHVAVLVPQYQSYDQGIMYGIASFVQQSRHKWSVYFEDDPRVRLPNFEKWDGDGILTNIDNQKVLRSLGKASLPVVGLGGGYVPVGEEMQYAYVGTDNYDIARLAFEHLYSLGLRNFAYCGEQISRNDTVPAVGNSTSKLSTWSEERGNAFQYFANEAGCPCALFTARHSTRLAVWTRVQERLQNWLRKLTPPLGLMANCDRRARHVLEACRELGAHVPEDFAVIGVDNDLGQCDLSDPPLTSVMQNTNKIGYTGAELLDQMMLTGKPIHPQFLAIKARSVIARQSTDMLAVEDKEVANALRFIRKRACDPIQVSDVLMAIPLSRSSLENRFKQLLGRSIHAEIRRVQIERAKVLLAETDLPLSVVARRVGTRSVQYFTKLMRIETGSTPAKYRSNSRVANAGSVQI